MGVDGELEFVDIILNGDAKNYHAWSHRGWLAKRGAETDFKGVEWYIADDIRNNSAWNHRWLLSGILGREKEVEFVREERGGRNESYWNYVLALIRDGWGREELREMARRNGGGRVWVLTAELGEKGVVEECEKLMKEDVGRKKYWMIQRDRALKINGH